MADPTFDAVVDGFADQGIAALKATIKESWDAFTTQERIDATKLLASLVRYHLLDVVGQPVAVELAVTKVAFEQWSATGKQVAADATKQVLTEMFGLAGQFAGSALATFIKGIK
jgi:hypothetical protein